MQIVPQATDYSCGAASFLSILYYWLDHDGNESELYKELGTNPKYGTQSEPIARAARKRGLSAEVRQGASISDLRLALRRGETVMVEYQAWREPGKPYKPWPEDWEHGHYSVVIGLDNENIYLMDPSAYTGYGWLPISEFLERWHDEDHPKGDAARRNHHLAIFIRGHAPVPPQHLLRVQ